MLISRLETLVWTRIIISWALYRSIVQPIPYEFEASLDASSYVSISEQALPVTTTSTTRTSPFHHLFLSSSTTTTSFVKLVLDG
uniref:F5/8 type C domain-containing protein n=1 Tax=Haemonchus contortus TaxID=6289 RepID=A0A7I4YLF5_HAECO|nr:unnamed protein product [Haemonchus contortus]